MPTHQKHINQLLQMTISRLNSFLNNLVLSQDRLFVVSFFYLHSHYTNNPAHKRVAEILPNGIFKSTYVNTMKNCIHFLCKNNWSNFASVGFACTVSPQR